MRFYAVTCPKDNLRSRLILAGNTQRDMLIHRQTHQKVRKEAHALIDTKTKKLVVANSEIKKVTLDYC